MDYQDHEAGLLLSMLAGETPAYGALQYVRAHDLYSWEAAKEIIARDWRSNLLYRNDTTDWAHVPTLPVREYERITRLPGRKS